MPRPKNESALEKTVGATQKTYKDKNAFRANTQSEYSENEVQELLSYITPPKKGTASRERWLKIISATCSALSGNEACALRLLKAWQEPWEKNAYETAIKSLHGRYECTIGTLIDEAKKNGYPASERAQERARRNTYKRRGSAGNSAAPIPALANTASPCVALGKCSLCDSAEKPQTRDTDLLKVLHEIKTGKWKNEIETLRQISDEKEQRNYKRTKLPQICVFGVYAGTRKDENLKTRSGFLVLDFDKKDNPKTDFDALKSTFSGFPFTLAAFTSPRGDGLKVLVRAPNEIGDSEALAFLLKNIAPILEPIIQSESSHYASPCAYVDSQSGARKHCFVSYDERMFINPAPIAEIPPFARAATDPKTKTPKLFFDLWERITFTQFKEIFSFALKDFYGMGKNYCQELRGRFVERGREQIERILKERGIQGKWIGKAISYIEQEKHIDEIHKNGRSGHLAGIYIEREKRIAVAGSPNLIEADKGKFPNIERLLNARFDDSENPAQYPALMLWLQRSRKRLAFCFEANLKGELPQECFVPMLCIMGKQSLGKSAIFRRIIAPLLGGRFANGKKLLAQDGQFTGASDSNEILLLDDISENDVRKTSRESFADKIKERLFSASAESEGKFENQSEIQGACWFVVELFNPEKIKATPDYYTAKDKMIFLNAGEFAPLAEKSDSDFAKLNKAIERELPAFAWWLENEFQAPATVSPNKDSRAEMRVGMKLYAHPACLELLRDNDKANIFLEEIDTCGSFPYERPLSASKIGEIIKWQSNRVGNSYGMEIKHLLATLKTRYPKRVELISKKPIIGKKKFQYRGWIIHAPQE